MKMQQTKTDNAAKLVGYATQPDGSLEEVTSADIPYNSPQGLVGV